MMRGHALRYAGWQVWDRAGPRLLACLLVSAAILWPLHFAMRESAPQPEQLRGFIAQTHQQFAFIFVLLFTNGLVATDRVQGYFRFYFAKPVSPLWFYAQHIGLAAAGMVAASAGYITLASLLLRPVWPWALIGNAVALFLLAGMLVVLFSTVTKYDWLGMVLVLVAAAILRARFPANRSTLGRMLDGVLPPNHLLGADVTLTAAQWAWVGGWAAGLFALTMVILARRPLGED